ncbi:hypothetical protein [Actibacterium sp. XHP0104]|uniref:hypothetical protein n=1 Tax=Actibacterium sp. XHP0104 TaxID=2984335 RepID=UPI0021E88F21|nr:hypothetical protein [Actibacterium sp. XHP0104]MCV2881015.1 hypothetical protein [Actibacterium sp. XHP0104]
MTSEPKRLPRVVAIGFNKCGTRGLGYLFEAAGHKMVHNKLRRPLRISRWVGRIMRDNIAAGRKVFDGIEDFTFYCDLIYSTPSETYDGNSAFREILRDYPGTVLLLNTRDREAWIRSRLRHGHGSFAQKHMSARGLADLDALADAWRAEWDAHHADVRAFMADKPEQLIVFDIQQDDIADLIERLPGYGLRAEDWRDIGRSRGRKMHPLVAWTKRQIAHNRPRSYR